MTSIEDIRVAADTAAAAEAELRRRCVTALDEGQPLRQIAIAARLSRQTIYKWATDARLTQSATQEETQP